MGKFDTQGGYFAPKDYFRINEGGSHEENPNGGVQIGVDPNGIPNVLEEGEPVYKDYVYSDNIKANKAQLAQHGIPEKYAGMLYSEIADKFVDEAEERPNDPVSTNGLNAMLLRLADAQEEQKQIAEQKALEKELAKLSPEELAQLEEMLAAQEAEAQVPEQEAVPMQQPMMQELPPAAIPAGAVPAQMPMMANGGLLRTFADGGELTDEEKKAMFGTISPAYDNRMPLQRLIDRIVDSSSNLRNAAAGIRRFSESPVGAVVSSLVPNPEDGIALAGANFLAEVPEVAKALGVSGRRKANSLLKDITKVNDFLKYETPGTKAATEAGSKLSKLTTEYENLVGKIADSKVRNTAKNHLSHYTSVAAPVKEAGSVAEEVASAAKDAAKSVPGKVWGVAKYAVDPFAVWKSSWKPTSAAGKIGKVAAGLAQGTAALGNDVALIDMAKDQVTSRAGANSAAAYENDKQIVHPFDFGGMPYTYNDVYLRHYPYKTTLGARSVSPQLRALRSQINNLSSDNGTPAAFMSVPSAPYMTANAAYLPAGVSLQPSTAMFQYRLNKHAGDGSAVNNGDALTKASLPAVGATTADGLIGGARDNSGMWYQEGSEVPAYTSAAPQMLPTWPRYAGAVTSGLLGLYNTFQRPDKYTIRRFNPVVPTGRLELEAPVYNPLDENMVVNDVLSSGAGTVRALENSGLGPSAGAALVAADYNLGNNLGEARAKVWDANNQRINDVIAQRNANEKAKSDFYYAQDRDRAQILNNAQLHNIQNELYNQRLNYAAEAEKYAAIQNSINAIAQALSGIGQENFATNQVNSAGYDYRTGPGGWNYYSPYAKFGGTLLRNNKKK